MADLYITSQYFIATTATTVGYGDIYAYTEVEMLFLTFIELAGICIFSILSTFYDQIILVPNFKEIIAARSLDFIYYLQSIDMARGHVNMEDYIYEDTV